MRKATAAQIAAVQSIAEPALDKFEIHEARAAGKLDLKNLALDERAFLGTCQDIYRNSRGTATPFENFITTVIGWTTWGNPPTPAALIREITTELEGDFKITLHSVQRFLGNYPNLISTAPPATPETPALEQATQPATKGTAKAQRARKPRKKVARAA